MSKNINDASLANLKHYKAAWRSGATRTIRVPVALAEATLEYARQLDEGVKSPDTSELNVEAKRLKDEVERLQNELSNLKADETFAVAGAEDIEFLKEENEGLKRLLNSKSPLALSDFYVELQKLRERNREVRLKAGEERRASIVQISDLRQEVQELRSQLETVRAENEQLRANLSAAEFELPEAADLLNRLKSKRRKTTTSFADVEAILEILEELTPVGGD